MSEDDLVQQPRNKTIVFTLEERKFLLKLVNMHFDVLNNKRVDSASTGLKNQAWEKIHKQFSENSAVIPRTPVQLKRCWENMKCKARKGDPMSVKLLRWGEEQYKLLQNGEQKRENQGQIGSSLDLEDSDFELKDEAYITNAKEKVEVHNSAIHTLENNTLKLNKVFENCESVHCSCEKAEKNSRFQLLGLQKQQTEELHQLKLQLMKEKIKHEKELYKLYVHEMTLKIENERRRAEILDRELNNNVNDCSF